MSTPTRTERAFVGYDGQDGYDDGMDWMEARTAEGWKMLPSWGRDGWDLGEWPLVCYMIRIQRGPYDFQLAEYCEGDETVWSFATREARAAFIDTIARDGILRRGDPLPADDAWRGPYVPSTAPV